MSTISSNQYWTELHQWMMPSHVIRVIRCVIHTQLSNLHIKADSFGNTCYLAPSTIVLGADIARLHGSITCWWIAGPYRYSDNYSAGHWTTQFCKYETSSRAGDLLRRPARQIQANFERRRHRIRIRIIAEDYISGGKSIQSSRPHAVRRQPRHCPTKVRSNHWPLIRKYWRTQSPDEQGILHMSANLFVSVNHNTICKSEPQAWWLLSHCASRDLLNIGQKPKSWQFAALPPKFAALPVWADCVIIFFNSFSLFSLDSQLLLRAKLTWVFSEVLQEDLMLWFKFTVSEAFRLGNMFCRIQGQTFSRLQKLYLTCHQLSFASDWISGGRLQQIWLTCKSVRLDSKWAPDKSISFNLDFGPIKASELDSYPAVQLLRNWSGIELDIKPVEEEGVGCHQIRAHRTRLKWSVC